MKRAAMEQDLLKDTRATHTQPQALGGPRSSCKVPPSGQRVHAMAKQFTIVASFDSFAPSSQQGISRGQIFLGYGHSLKLPPSKVQTQSLRAQCSYLRRLPEHDKLVKCEGISLLVQNTSWLLLLLLSLPLLQAMDFISL
ncbi:hypothetical protein CB1_000200010 [Camelus ferus]|nr:hypothetical protein CB1_000200010 [Camelus ferus]